MKIGFVGHRFHQRTGSSLFFVDFLRRFAEVVELSVDPDLPLSANDQTFRQLMASRLDAYVFWQSEWVAERLPIDLGRSFIVPMFDAVRHVPSSYWRRFVKCRFLCFSRAVHEILQSAGCTTSYFQYFPEPGPVPDRFDEVGDRSAFFWERRPLEALSLPLVVDQCRQLGIRRLFVHAAPDFTAHAQPRSSGTIDGIEITVSTWHDTRADAIAAAAAPMFFFAPRAAEGIGMAMLEAMARGQIVIAPDLPTANEYLAHRVTGLLYDPVDPRLDTGPVPLDDAACARMSAAVHRRVARGHDAWVTDAARLHSIIVGDDRRWPTTDASAGFADAIRTAAHRRRLGDGR